MANYTINTAGSTTCNYPSTVNANDILTFNITNKNTTTKYQGSMLTYTFPCDCTAEILAAGAKGGNGAGSGTGGRGAIVAGTISFKTGDQLLICVGQAGTNNTMTSGSDGTTGAGGGGTYVVRKVSSSSYRYTGSGTGNNWYVEPLVIAAGGNGGGDNLYTGNSTTIHGSSNQGNENNMSYSSSTYYGGGFSKCSTSTDTSSGRSFLTGAAGATESYIRNNYTSYAGFGGGGAARDDGTCGGGGGGYTGGSQSGATAATSFVITTASNISRKSGNTGGNNGEGYVKITFKTVVPLHEIPDGFIEKIKESNTQVKVDNAWKEVDKSFVKVNNVWKEIDKIYTKAKNSWIETGKNTFYHNNWIVHEGYISDSMFYEGWIGNATYSSYTPGEGIKLYTAQGSTSNRYPVAIGAISSVYWIVAYKDTWKVSFQRTSGNTEFEIGVALVTDTSILTTGRLNTTNFNSITKKYGQRFNVDNGVFTFCLKELFGEEYEEELYDFDTYLAFYLYSPTNASTTIKITSALDCFPVHCVMHEGALEDTSMTGYYTGHSTYSPYSSTGISLYKASGTSYPISIGCFNAPMDAKKIYAVGLAYEVVGTTVPNASLGFAYFDSQYNGRTDSSGPTTVQIRFVATSPIDKLQGTVPLYIEDITDYTTLENVYFAVFLNSTASNSVTVKIKGIYFYISDDLELGGGTTPPASSSIFPVKNVQVYNDTEFGALTTSNNVTDDSGSMGLKVVTSASNLYAYTTRFSFNKKFDMSKIEKIIMKWAYRDSSLAGRMGEIFIGCTSTTYNSQGNTNNFTGKLTKSITLSQGASVIDTIEFTPTNWTGENYLSIGVCASTNNQALTIGIVELEIVLKAGSNGGSTGGETGGETQTATLRLSSMFPADEYSSTWANASRAYDDSSTTYAYLTLNSAVMNYQALVFNSNGISLNNVNITKATLYLDATYHLTSGSLPNVGVTVYSMGENDTIKSLQSFHNITTTTVVDITSYISNSINNSGNVELIFETYNMNSSGVTGQIRMHEAYIELEYGGGGNTGGSGTSGISFRQGYIDSADGEYVYADNYESIVTDKVSVKSMSNTSTISFTVTSSTSISAKAYFEVWSSDGTQGNFIGYIDLNGYAFSAYRSVTISLTKNEIADHLNAGSGYDIGHVALSLYADTIHAEYFTVSTNAGVTPRDDI